MSRFRAAAGNLGIDAEKSASVKKEAIWKALHTWTGSFVRRCILPRCSATPEDAVYCVRFIEAAHKAVVQVWAGDVLGDRGECGNLVEYGHGI